MASNSIHHILDQLCDPSTSLTLHSSMSNSHLPPPPLCHQHHLPLLLMLPPPPPSSLLSHPSTTTSTSPFPHTTPHHHHHHHHLSLFSSLRPASPPSHVLLPHMHIVNLRSTNTPKFSTFNASVLDTCCSWTRQRHFCICPHSVEER